MLYTKSLFVIASALLLTKVESAFNATSNSNIVYYWYGLNIPVKITVKLKKENYNRGQNSAGATGDESLWQKVQFNFGWYFDCILIFFCFTAS